MLTFFEVGEQTTRSPCLPAALYLAILLARRQWNNPVVPSSIKRVLSNSILLAL